MKHVYSNSQIITRRPIFKSNNVLDLWYAKDLSQVTTVNVLNGQNATIITQLKTKIIT